ncbi:MAG: recF [Thermoleophilia bacterium]|nr:recF [Thermoleophilia bacterium]
MTTERQPAGVAIRRLELVDVRTYAHLVLEFAPGVTVLLGPNGVGKTNLLEACAVVLQGSSPRTSAELRLVRDGAAGARIAAQVAVAGDVHDREVRFVPARGKQLRLDGSPARSIDEYQHATPVVTFLPERLLTIRGAPARRRAIVDQLALRLDPVAAGATQRAYARAVQQRNNVLRRGKGGGRIDDELTPWTQQVIEHGEELRAQRSDVLTRLAAPFAERFTQLTDLADAAFELELRGDADIEAALAAQLPIDRRRGSTTTGPHLDDILPRHAGRDLRAFGSTGEQRSALLAFTLAARDLIEMVTRRTPVVLLDEPWSELDRDRRSRLSELLPDLGQVIATSTDPPRGIASEALLSVSSGAIAPWTTDHNPSSTSPT